MYSIIFNSIHVPVTPQNITLGVLYKPSILVENLPMNKGFEHLDKPHMRIQEGRSAKLSHL